MKIFKKISIHTLVTILLLVPTLARAELSIAITNPFQKGGGSLMDLIIAIMDGVVFPIATILVVIWIIWAGFSYVLAQGKPAKIQEANQRLLWSLIGAGILLSAKGIAVVVQNTVNALK